MDQCQECSVRGDLPKCEATPCSKHDSWYAQELKKQIEEKKDFVPRNACEKAVCG